MNPCCCCNGPCCLSMATVNVNPSISQMAGGSCGNGGACNLSGILNSVGRWGTVLASVATGKPIATTRTGVPVGAVGSTAIGGISTSTLLIIGVVILALLFLFMRR